MKSIKTFISSSENELESEREVSQEVVNQLNMSPFLFELSPALSNSPFNAFLEKVEECDIFVMILWQTLRPAVYAEYKKAIENHKPILILVKNLKFEEERDDKLKKFISEFKYDNIKENVKISSWRNFRSLSDFREVLKNSLSQEISKFYKEPTHTLSREEMYDLGSNIINTTQKRLFLFQRTPSLFYLDPHTDTFHHKSERNLVKNLRNWINRHYFIDDVEFTYFFDLELTKNKIKKINEPYKSTFIDQLKKNLNEFKEIEKSSRFNFKFTYLDTQVSGPIIIGDNRYAIWILGREDSFGFSQENQKISNILIRRIKAFNQELKSFDDIIKKLEI